MTASNRRGTSPAWTSLDSALDALPRGRLERAIRSGALRLFRPDCSAIDSAALKDAKLTVGYGPLALRLPVLDGGGLQARYDDGSLRWLTFPALVDAAALAALVAEKPQSVPVGPVPKTPWMKVELERHTAAVRALAAAPAPAAPVAAAPTASWRRETPDKTMEALAAVEREAEAFVRRGNFATRTAGYAAVNSEFKRRLPYDTKIAIVDSIIPGAEPGRKKAPAGSPEISGN